MAQDPVCIKTTPKCEKESICFIGSSSKFQLCLGHLFPKTITLDLLILKKLEVH